MIPFIFLGVLNGFLGSAFVALNGYAVRLNKRLKLNHWVSTGLVSCLVGLLTFPGLIGMYSFTSLDFISF